MRARLFFFFSFLCLGFFTSSCNKSNQDVDNGIVGTIWETEFRGGIYLEFTKDNVYLWAEKSETEGKVEGKYTIDNNLKVKFSDLSIGIKRMDGHFYLSTDYFSFESATFTTNTLTVIYTTLQNAQNVEKELIFYRMGLKD